MLRRLRRRESVQKTEVEFADRARMYHYIVLRQTTRDGCYFDVDKCIEGEKEKEKAQ